MDSSSEFFSTPSSATSPENASARMLISRSVSGYSEIWRIDRNGKFRILKCLKQEYRGNSLYERLLLKEFEIGYSLNHRNICEYYSFFNDAELGNCIEMEWVDGCDLDKFLSEHKRDKSVCDKIIDEICSALKYMHAKQVLHRDLKPSNILITYSGNNVRLIDFGLSDSDSSSILKNPAGTAIYAAPEVRAGGKASISSDLYSLGMVMSLFPKKHSCIVRKLCAADAEDRYQSVIEVKNAIERRSQARTWATPAVLIILIILVIGLTKHFGDNQTNPNPSLSPNPSVITDTPVITEVQDMTESKDIELPEATQSTNTVPVPAGNQAIPSGVTKTPRSNQTTTKKPDTPSTGTTTNPNLIDELFREATELFE